MNYSIFDPTGNITAIVTEPVDIGSRAAAAAEVMRLEPAVEQVGFLLPGKGIYDADLRMAGGEFCGNASMSAAALCAINSGMAAGEKKSLVLRVSGTPDPVMVELEAISELSFRGRVSMPEALEITEVLLPEEDELAVPVVSMPGIAHAIVPESFGAEAAEEMLPSLCAQLGADAMGIMLVDDGFTRITPVVYVPGSGITVREHSCASGTAAVGACIAAMTGEHIRMSFAEPGGILTVEADPESGLYIEGRVELMRQV